MFVADLHNDIVQRAMIGEDVGKFTKQGHTDLSRLIESCVDLEILIIWVSTIDKSESAFQKANEMYDKIEDLSINNNLVDIPKDLNSIIENKKNNLLSIPIGIEGGEAIENSIDKLFHFIERGILYFGPTWNHSLDWVSSGKDEFENNDKIKTKGLSKFGKEVIHVCNENNVIIDSGVKIGENTFIGNNCVISNSIIGRNCVIESGTIIGGSGFGFTVNEKISIEHFGNVIIGDNVKIGSNCTIDRASIDSTIIDDNVRLDNLIQIAHGVKISMNSIIAAQVGIAGSTSIGSNCIIGGQAGNFLNLKIFPAKILALITASLVLFVALRMGLKIF